MNLFKIIKLATILVVSCLSFSLTSQNAAMVIDSAKGVLQDGLRVVHASDDGVQVSSAGGDGVYIEFTDEDGVHINSAGGDGVVVGAAGDDGVYVFYAGDDGVFVQSAEVNGLHVSDAGQYGVFVDDSDSHGIVVNSAGSDGVRVNFAVGDGIYINDAGDDGITVDDAEDDGISIGSPNDDGVVVFASGDDAFYVDNAGGDGIHVHTATSWSMNIQGDKNLTATPTGHIAQIYNRANEGSADVLALKVGRNSNPGTGSNFITFFDGDDDPLGRFEGNGSGGVVFGSPGADFAEFMPVQSNEEDFSPGDVVGIVDGKVTFNTRETSKVMVITDSPIVVGNQHDNGSNHEMVGFIGQVSVKVIGKVNAGDWIVASDLSDGTGVSIGPVEITLDHKIVGQAWESNDDPGVKRVNTVIGLDHSQAKDVIIKNVQKEMKTQQLEIKDLQMKNTDLQLQINELKKAITELRN